jgi:hypothetical protein
MNSRCSPARFACLALGLALGLACLAPSVRAGLPQPMCVFYGQARNAYNLPCLDHAEVLLFRDAAVIARHPIRGSLAPGVNFALYVHLDDGRGARPYSPRALRTGDRISIVVRDAEGDHPILESPFLPPVGAPGDLHLLNVTAGEDTDGDGLSDRWEWELIAWSQSALRDLTDVRGEDDFDGDGLSNREEYLAGTFAFLSYDALIAEELVPASSGWLRLTFLSVPGIQYGVRGVADLSDTEWLPCSFSLTDAGPLQTLPTEGDGDWISLYLPLDTAFRFYRLFAR